MLLVPERNIRGPCTQVGVVVAAGVTDGAAIGAGAEVAQTGLSAVEGVVTKGDTVYAPVIIFAVAAICVE